MKTLSSRQGVWNLGHLDSRNLGRRGRPLRVAETRCPFQEVEGRELGDRCSEFLKYAEGKKRFVPMPEFLCSQ